MSRFYMVLFFCFISVPVSSDDLYISYAEFKQDEDSFKLIVDVTRNDEFLENENYIIYKTFKFKFNNENFFIGSVNNKKDKTASQGLFRDCNESYLSILDRGLGFYTKINNDYFVILNDGKEAKGFPTFTKFYLLKIVDNQTKFKLVHEIQGVAISDVFEKNGKYYASGFKIDGFYAAEVTFDNKSLLFEPLEMVRYLASDL